MRIVGRHRLLVAVLAPVALGLFWLIAARFA